MGKTFGQTVCSGNLEEEVLEAEWERVRHQFMIDDRTLGELDALTGKEWVASKRGDVTHVYAVRSWEKLRSTPGMGLKKLRGLVALFSAAANR